MTTTNRPRIIASSGTAIAAVAIFLLLLVCKVSLPDSNPEWPPRHDVDITMEPVDDNYFEVVAVAAKPVASTPAPAHNPVDADNLSTPAPASGPDLTDNGPAGDPVTPVTTSKPAPVQQQTMPEAKKPGPDKELEKQKKLEEEARRKASAATMSAFKKADGKNNTANRGATEGNSGRTDGTSLSVNGTGKGTVGGGWVIPAYAKVPSTSTGSIVMRVTIDRTGKVTAVTFQGGDAPAATDAALRAACEREVRSRIFTRTDDNAPDQATAYITYTFR